MSLLQKMFGKRQKRTHPYCAALIAAAGSSTRYGGENKLLQTLDGIPVLVRTLLTIDRVEGIDEIVIAAREDELLSYAELCKTFGLRKPVKVIVGGATRTESVLRAALEASPETEFFAVQDGARPLVTVELIDEVLDAARVYLAAAPLFSPQETVEAFERALAHEPDAVICTHVSNVFGAILPIERIAQLCRGASVPLIIDASQSAGSLPIDFSALAPAFLAMPGHKGLYGPQGTGLLLCGSDALPLIEGGTGSESLRQSMPDFLPDRLEAGTHNVPGIAGLEAGIAFVRAQRPERILHHSRALIRRAGEGLGKIPNVHGFLSLEASLQAGVLSFTVDGLSPESVAEEMAKRGIALRAGLHCAPFAHKTVGTLPDGTVRLSVSAFNRESEIDTFLSSLRAIAAGQAKN